MGLRGKDPNYMQNQQKQKAIHLQQAISALKQCIALDVTDQDEDKYLTMVIRLLVQGYNEYQNQAAQTGMQGMGMQSQMQSQMQTPEPELPDMTEGANNWSPQNQYGNRGIGSSEMRGN